MRILGFSKKWAKLHLELPVEQRPPFTIFRFPRKDAPKGRDWHLQEQVQIVYHPRSKERVVLGIAEFTEQKESGFTPESIPPSDQEAVADGFRSSIDMTNWMYSQYKSRIYWQLMYKWTLKWIAADPL